MKTENKILKLINERLREINSAISGGNGYLQRPDIKKKTMTRATIKTLEFLKRELETLKSKIKELDFRK